MNKNLLLLVSFIVLMETTLAQSTEVITKNFIEVTGTSEMEITPDELYVTITLKERMDGKEKITIEKQEADLKQILKDLGIDLNNLVLNSADANYSKVRKSTRDVLIDKSYILKTTGTDMLTKVYERLEQMNAYDAYVSRYTHSKLVELQKENRIKAVKAAKDKVDYLLAVLGQTAGKALEIKENENEVQNNAYRNWNSISNNYVSNSNDRSVADDESSEIAFKKIKIKASFLVKYEIK